MRNTRTAFALLIALAASSAHADDCIKEKNIDDMKTLIQGLGYEAHAESNLLKITVNSTYNYPIYFSLDKANLTVFTVLEDLSEEKIARIPTVLILQFNDAHYDYLSLNRRNGALRFVMQNTIPSCAATPAILRSTIARLVDDANASDTLWNPSKWN